MATLTVNATLGNDSVSNAQLENMAQGTIKGRQAGAGTGDPQDLTPDQASTILDAATDPFVRTSDLPSGGTVLTGNILWVDAVNGNDATAVRGEITKPYLTPSAASTDAQSGDTVVVLPGDYTVTSNLAKDGVNWYGYPGASLSMTSTSSNQSIFSDEGNAMSFVVDGAFDMELTTDTGAGEQQWTVFFNNANSNVKIKANQIIHVSGNDDADAQGAVAGYNGTLKLEAFAINSSGVGSGITIFWGVGDMHVKADRITSNHIAIQAYATIDPPGEFFVDAQYIASTGTAYTIQDSSTEGESRTWIKASHIINSNGGALFLASGGLVYVEAEKIGGDSGNPAIFLLGHVTNGGFNWITAQKISSANNFIHAEGYAENYVVCQHYEDNGVSVGIDVDDSTLNLDGGIMVLDSADGIDISGGVCYAKSLTIDTSADSGSNPIVKSGGTLTISHCHLIAEGTQNSIEAPTAQSVTNVASYSARPVDTDVMLVGYPIGVPAGGGGIADGDALSIGLTFPNAGLKMADQNADHTLVLVPNENLSADRQLSFEVNDANRTIDLAGDLTVSANATVSGTNTGDQTIELTGDVTGSGTGSFAATIANDAVTYAKMQNVSATDRLLGRSTAGAGNVEEITCTAAGRALLDDADAGAQRETLGLIRRKVSTATTGVGTSYTDVTNLNFSVVSGTTYFINGWVLAECSNTGGGVCLSANGPTATYYAARYEGTQTGGGSSIRADIVAYDSLGTLGDVTTVTAANTPYIYIFQAMLVPSASGTFTLRVKRGGGAGNVAVRAGMLEATGI